MAADWSILPDLLLVLILQHLPSYVDYTHFRAVCSAWRNAAPKRSPMPWLVGSHVSNSKLFNLSAVPNHQIRSIDALSDVKFDGFSFCGSSNSWMIFCSCNSYSSSMIFHNPITNSRISFPPFSFPYTKILQISLSEDSTRVLVIRYDRSEIRVQFCRVGDSDWTVMDDTQLDQCIPPVWALNCVNAIFHNNHFYIMSGVLEMYICDIGPNPRLVSVPIAYPPEGTIYTESDNYLVESASGDLLLVLCKHFVAYYYSFQVFKVDLAVQPVQLSKLDSLGDCALFVGVRGSLSCFASKTGCRANSIYFMASAGGRKFIMVCSLEDGNHEALLCPVDGYSLSSWIMPNLGGV